MRKIRIIQGGMGVAVSSWKLARAVSRAGQLGVISGTALDLVLVRRLGLGDVDGDVRRALDHYPVREVADRIYDRYYVPGGKDENSAFKSKPVPARDGSKAALELIVVANFVEVFLAKEGHDGPVGINLLTKIQIPTVPSLLGAMMAGVDYVLMGAGIPRAIPGILDKLSRLEVATLALDVVGLQAGEEFFTTLDPKEFVPETTTDLKRPEFLAIISSATLAASLYKKASGKVNGFIVEGATAGGHNAPPRGTMTLSELGEPIYGPRDEADLEAIREIGLPFWLAGSYGIPGRLEEALATGAEGIQVGSAFALCDESGVDETIKRKVIKQVLQGDASVFTDPLASPTGFPFKVMQVDGTLSDSSVWKKRPRICDLGYLRTAYRKEDGTMGYRCPAEPVGDYIAKGGKIEETEGRKCICNGLMATIGMAQYRKSGEHEPPIVTAGDEVRNIGCFVRPGSDRYSALDVIVALLRPTKEAISFAVEASTPEVFC